MEADKMTEISEQPKSVTGNGQTSDGRNKKQNDRGNSRDRIEERVGFDLMMKRLADIGVNRFGTERIQAVEAFLEEVAVYTGADHISVFELLNSEFYERIYEYRISADETFAIDGGMLERKGFEAWNEAFDAGETIVAESETDPWIKMLPASYQEMAGGEIHTLIAFPFQHNNSLMGFFSIENADIKMAKNFLSVIPVIGAYLGSVRTNYQKENTIRQHVAILNQNRLELDRERQFLNVLCRDYTSVYYADLASDTFEALKIDPRANAAEFKELVGERHSLCYSRMIRQYGENYVVKGQSEMFLNLMSLENLSRELAHKERIMFHYQSVPNKMGQRYFEIQVIRICESRFDHKVLVGFRHVDDLVAREQRQRQELERALEDTKRSNEVLSALGKIYYAIFRIDLEQDTYEEISSNRKVHHLTGTSGQASTEMIELCNHFVVPDYRDQIMHFFDLSTLADRLEQEETIATEYLATDGNWHTARFIVKRRNHQGRVTHVLYVTRLISDTKRREQNWIAIAEEANKANEAKTEFISQVAHDIRTPMNAIVGFTEITEKHVDDPEQVRYGLEKIRVAGAFLQELVDDVLDISRIENGQMKIQPEEFSITKMMEEFKPAFEHAQIGKNLRFCYDIHDISHDWILADPLRLKQIFTNILSNSVKYTPDGGTIGFEIYEKAVRTAGTIGLTAVIWDTGIGMSKEYMEKMYSKFTRETDTRINKVSGYGLGLSIVKELTDLMNGRIEVESEQGKGTTFRLYFEFPYAEPKSEDRSQQEDSDKSSLCEGMHLLVAEDNELNFEVAKELLEMKKITCEQAENGAVCVEKFEENPERYDAILMDMQMPVMNGIEAAMAIRRLSVAKAHTIPILAMTANAFQEDVQRCLNAGMNAHLSKPIDMKKLIKELAKLKTSAC